MKFEREALLAVLTNARPALPARGGGVTPELSYFWFDKRYVYAYDGGLGVRLAYASELDLGVPGIPLMELLRTSALKEVSMVVGADGVLTLQMGKSKVQLATLPSERRPWPFPELNGVHNLTLTERVLAALKEVLFLKVKQELHAVHFGVTVVPRKSWLEFYTTDSVGVAQALVRERPDKLPRFVLPWAFINRVLSLIKPGATLQVLDKCLMVAAGDVLICSNRLELPEFPDLPTTLERTVPEGAPIALPEGLQPVLERARILAGEKEPLLTLTVKDGTLHVQGSYPLGTVDEALPLGVELPEVTARFAADRIGLGLGSADSFMLSKRALVLYGGEDFLYVTAARSGGAS